MLPVMLEITEGTRMTELNNQIRIAAPRAGIKGLLDGLEQHVEHVRS